MELDSILIHELVLPGQIAIDTFYTSLDCNVIEVRRERGREREERERDKERECDRHLLHQPGLYCF